MLTHAPIEKCGVASHAAYSPEASDGIASAKRCSYFDLVDDPDVSSEDLPKIKHFYAWKRKPLTTPLCWDCALFRVLGYSMKYDDKRND